MNRAERRGREAFARTIRAGWTPFERLHVEHLIEYGNCVACWRNNRYSVQVFDRTRLGVPFTHIAIRRHDNETEFPWSDLQRIKNEICGPEREAVEMFPAHSEVVDLANMRHLFVLSEGSRLPFTIRGPWT
jgi:hypothetical protein